MRLRHTTDSGFITYRDEGSIIVLETVWTHRLQRGKGRGTEMVANFMKTLGTVKVIGEVWDKRPLRFYKNLGFTLTYLKDKKIWAIEKDVSTGIVNRKNL